MDQSVYRPSDLLRGVRTKNGFHNWVAGYDYNPTEFVGDGFQGNFLNNGIITPDRAWTAKLTEVKAVYAPAAFSDWDAATRFFTLRNKLAFSDLSDLYDLSYQLLRDGYVVEQQTLLLPAVPAGESAQITVPYHSVLDAGAEYVLHLFLRLKRAPCRPRGPWRAYRGRCEAPPLHRYDAGGQALLPSV